MFNICQNPETLFPWFELDYESHIFSEVSDFWIPLCNVLHNLLKMQIVNKMFFYLCSKVVLVVLCKK